MLLDDVFMCDPLSLGELSSRISRFPAPKLMMKGAFLKIKWLPTVKRFSLLWVGRAQTAQNYKSKLTFLVKMRSN